MVKITCKNKTDFPIKVKVTGSAWNDREKEFHIDPKGKETWSRSEGDSVTISTHPFGGDKVPSTLKFTKQVTADSDKCFHITGKGIILEGEPGAR